MPINKKKMSAIKKEYGKKLTKLFNQGEEIKTQYENKMQELISKYGESILNELI